MLEFTMKRPLEIIPLLIAFLLAVPTISLSGQFKVTRVYDGDTIMAEGHDIVIYVLLAGIDAPEIASRDQQQPCGQGAKRHLEELVLNRVVDIKGYDIGPYPYNYLIGEIHLQDRNINVEMLTKGLAEVWRERPPDGLNMTPYLEAEREAKAAGRGMWSLGDKYMSPGQWRKMQRAR